MKTTAFAMSLMGIVALSGPVSAGSTADPVVEPEVIVADTTGSSSGTALVAALAVLLAIPALD